uniref:SARAH domain-containing protein n=1 Tax=Panagrolaimus sp. ES5 TaxID=591445 RepID=A0AC34G196_9BILA
MQNRNGNYRMPGFLEGVPGVYQRRQSPPRLPSTIATPQRRKSGTPDFKKSGVRLSGRTRFGSQSSCASTSMQIPEDSQLITTGNEIPPLQQQRHAAARRPVPRSHPTISSSTSRDLSSHSFSDASKRTELTVFRKSLTSSQSIGNVVQHEIEPNELERRSQFDHPGVATPSSNIAEVHGSVQSIVPNRNKLNEDIEDLNIISEEIPLWLQMYSEAESSTDHLLNFNLFKLQQLEIFDEMLLKLFKQDAINTVIKYEKPRREINSELFRRLIVR